MGDQQADRVADFGPVQVLAVAFDDVSRLDGQVLEELKRLREQDVVRLVDLLVVAREGDELRVVQHTDLSEDEAMTFGAIVGALLGVGAGREGEELASTALAGAAELADGHVFDDNEVWYLADAIPPGTAAAVALLEHRWARTLRDRIVERGGQVVADQWIHPADLVAVGAAHAAATS